MNRKSRLVALAALIAVTGCVKPPPPTTPEVDVTVPQEWTGRPAVAGEVDTEWWDEFGDPQLSSLIELALTENADLWAAATRVDRALAEARIAGADLKPTLGVGLNAARQRFNPATFGTPASPTTFSNFGLSLDVSWEVDLWGRMRAGARAALAQAQAVDADYAGAKLSISGQTAKTWFAVQEALLQAELARSSAKSFRRASEFVRTRYEGGLRPPLDLRLALSNLAAAEALLQLRLQQTDRATRQLEILLARYPGAALLDMFPASRLPDLPPPVPAGLPAEIVSRRPDLVAAERRVVAGDQELKFARRSLYPRLSLTGSAGTIALELADLVDGDFGVWSLAANLAQPLFQGGRLRAGVDRAAAGGEEALALYVASVLRAYGEVEIALAAEAYLRERARHLEEAAKQTVAAQRLAEQRYAEGLGEYLVVLESQSRALTSQSEFLAVRRALLDNRVDLHLALGGGFDYPGRRDEPAPDDDDETAMVAKESRDE